MSGTRREFYLLCGSLLSASAVVLALHLGHPQGGVVPRASGPRPAASPSPSVVVPRVSPPAAGLGSAGSSGAAVPAARVTSPVAVSSSSAAGAVPRRSPVPRPSPAGGVAAQVGAALVVPLRGSTPVAVRVSVAVPTGPPPPLLDLGALLTGVGG